MSGTPRAETSPQRARAIHREKLCDRFEAAWRAVRAGGGRPCLEDFLAETSEPEHESLLEELVQVEIDYRRELGERPSSHDYCQRFPALSPGWLNEILNELATLPFGSARIASPSMTGRTFGDYELLAEIARGGMGVVYKARQVSLNRIVALKMILAGSHASDADVLRFRAEAEAAANLDDPGIVPIYEVGKHEGLYFFSMGYVEGNSLAERLVEGPLPPRNAAEIVRDTARAVHYAHQEGVIHRDLKPANILIDRTNRPRVTDFGLAKRMSNDSSLTASGQVLGTPSYMPPEQAAGKVDQVGPLADVYALGAVLYAALTGRPPFQAATPAATLQQVLDQEPAALGAVNRSVPQDLETITLKCLEKSPHRRYATAAELADDLDRWLTGQTILARRSRIWERAIKWARRRPAVAALSGMLAAVALVAFVLVTSLWLLSTAARLDAQRLAARLAMDKAQSLCEAGDVNRGLLWFDHTLSLIPKQDNDLQQTVRANLGAWKEQVVGLKAILHHPLPVELQAFSADGTLLLSVCRDHRLRIWNVVDGRLLSPLTDQQDHANGILVATFSPDAKENRILTVANDGVARLWVVTRENQIQFRKQFGESIITAIFSPDGKRIVTGSRDGQLCVWDTTGDAPLKTAQTSGPVQACVFNFDGTRLATSTEGGKIQFWNAESWELATSQPQDQDSWAAEDKVRLLTFTSTGKRLLAVVQNEQGLRQARVWDAETGRSLPDLPTRWGNATVAVSPRSEVVLTGESDGIVQLLDLDSASLKPTLLQHNDAVEAVAFSPGDGRTLLTGSQDGTARLWDAATTAPLCPPLQHPGPVEGVAFAPDGVTFSTLCQDGSVRLWSMPRPNHLSFPQGSNLMALAVSSDGRLIATGTSAGVIQVRQTEDGTPMWPERANSEVTNSGETRQDEDFAVWALSFFANSKRLLTGGRDESLRIWEATTGEPRGGPIKHSHRLRSLAVSADGKLLLTGSGNAGQGIACLWYLLDGKPIDPPLVLNEVVWAVAFAPTATANVCAVASSENTIRLWQNLKLPPPSPTEPITISPDEVKNHTRLPAAHRSRVVALAFSPDGKWLVSGSTDGTAQLWNVATELLHGEPLRHDSAVWAVAFDANSRFLVTGCRDGSVNVWDVATGASVGPTWRHEAQPQAPVGQTVWTLACDRQGHIWSGSDDDTLRRWPLPIPLVPQFSIDCG